MADFDFYQKIMISRNCNAADPFAPSVDPYQPRLVAKRQCLGSSSNKTTIPKGEHMSNAIATARTRAISAEHFMPDYVSCRMDAHYVTRIEQLLGGEHPHAWQPTPEGAIFLAGNDYLCLGGEPALVQAQLDRLAGSGGALLMSAVYLQQGSPQHRLERKFARLMGAEDGILTQSGWAANVGLVQCLASPGVPVYLDMQAHASLWEGVQSAGAEAVSFLHNELDHLRRQLARHGRGIIAVDALYSTNGSVAPLAALVELAERSGCLLVVDESHSLGTHGPRGAGLVAQLGLAERVHFRTASLAKAFAGRAGFITCSSKFKGYFLSESRPAIFSSCLLEHELAWFDAAIDFVAAADVRTRSLVGARWPARRAGRHRPAPAHGAGRAGLQRQRRHGADHRAGSGGRAAHAGPAQGAGAPGRVRRHVLRPGHAQEPLAGAPDAERGPGCGTGSAGAGRLRRHPRPGGTGELVVQPPLAPAGAGLRDCVRRIAGAILRHRAGAL
jgi:CAI-1 autoinducer synthase